jgi:hypothetical protein
MISGEGTPMRLLRLLPLLLSVAAFSACATAQLPAATPTPAQPANPLTPPSNFAGITAGSSAAFFAAQFNPGQKMAKLRIIEPNNQSCYALRTYGFKSSGPEDSVPRLSSYTTCTRASASRLKELTLAPK